MAKYAKIQKNIDGKEKYSITPQIPGGYITPENLIKIGEVAKKYNASLKLTSAQKICIGNLKEEDMVASIAKVREKDEEEEQEQENEES